MTDSASPPRRPDELISMMSYVATPIVMGSHHVASNPLMAQLEAVLGKHCSSHATPGATAGNAGPSNGTDLRFLAAARSERIVSSIHLHHDYFTFSGEFHSLSSLFVLSSAMSFEGSPFSPAHLRSSASPASGTTVGQTAHYAGAYTRPFHQYDQCEHQLGNSLVNMNA